jgi:hypothetical protein
MRPANPNDNPPVIFFVLLICIGVFLIIGGWCRWPFTIENRGLSRLLNMFSTEEKNDYNAAFRILAGIVMVITGLLGLFFF